ncbi:unnamed protein product [Closterium sp. NIES-53]
MAAQELRWLTYLVKDLGKQPRSPPVLYVDNKAIIALCLEHRLEHITNHNALRYFLARELQQRGQLCLAYMATRANTADIFTKELLPGDHQRFSTALGLLALLFLTGLVTTCSPPLCLWGVAGRTGALSSGARWRSELRGALACWAAGRAGALRTAGRTGVLRSGACWCAEVRGALALLVAGLHGALTRLAARRAGLRGALARQAAGRAGVGGARGQQGRSEQGLLGGNSGARGRGYSQAEGARRAGAARGQQGCSEEGLLAGSSGARGRGCSQGAGARGAGTARRQQWRSLQGLLVGSTGARESKAVRYGRQCK